MTKEKRREIGIVSLVFLGFSRKSEEAPEALFYGVSYLAWQSRFPEAMERLQQIEKYSKSISL